MRERFSRFMMGRYGSDEMSRATVTLAMVFLILSLIIRIRIFNTLCLALLIYNMFRMFSRNHAARCAENDRYLALKSKLIGRFDRTKSTPRDKEHKYYACPKCRQKLRVPKGRGRIAITCPKCGTEFVKRT